jgi:hypothetical protein
VRPFLTVIFLILFAWNSVLGGMAALVFCLHQDGEAHLELFADGALEADRACVGSDTKSSNAECPPCKDVTLASVDLGSLRPNELTSVQVPQPVASSQDTGNLPDGRWHAGCHVEKPRPTERPPGVEPLAEQVSRVIVLRL